MTVTAQSCNGLPRHVSFYLKENRALALQNLQIVVLQKIFKGKSLKNNPQWF